MRRFRWRFTVPALGVCVLVLTALHAAFAPAANNRSAAAMPVSSQKVKATVISVTAGKPSELAFKLSKSSMVPAGTVTFKVTNLGVAFHNFKLCTIPVASAVGAKNACIGKATPVLKHGKSATFTVKLSMAGKYEFLCSVVGHAAAGMKGLLGVGVAVSASEQKIAAKAGSSSGTEGGGGSGGGTGGGSGGGSGGGGSGGAEIGPAVGCPPGVTVKASGNADADGDELGTEPDDQDGCV
jgi:uncharacterized cupredoxin-like copper-binding protein